MRMVSDSTKSYRCGEIKSVEILPVNEELKDLIKCWDLVYKIQKQTSIKYQRNTEFRSNAN